VTRYIVGFSNYRYNEQLPISLSITLYNKQLSYRTGTEWRAISVEILSIVAQLYDKPHLKRLAAQEWPWRSLKAIKIGAIQQAMYYFLLVVSSNNVSILHHFGDTTTFTEYVTSCDLEKLPPIQFPISLPLQLCLTVSEILSVNLLPKFKEVTLLWTYAFGGNVQNLTTLASAIAEI